MNQQQFKARLVTVGRGVLAVVAISLGVSSAVAAQEQSPTTQTDSVSAGKYANALVAATPPVAKALGSTGISVISPFGGDANRNSYTTYSYGGSPAGPWTPACDPGVPGDSAWRRCSITGLAANTDYFVHVTFVDPDGVIGGNDFVLGPVHTLAVAQNATTIEKTTVTNEATSLLASVEVKDDDNANSSLTVDVASNPGGPWTTKCGPAPQMCRLVGLTHNAEYYVRFTETDPDGVNGTNPRVVGPVTYRGLTDLALGKPVITSVPGWGCCSDANQLVDGRIQYTNWMNGFAFCGGTASWGGCGPGVKSAIVDLGIAQPVARLEAYTHDAANIPLTWSVQVSTDNLNWPTVYQNQVPQCRTATGALAVNWATPRCAEIADFAPVTARFVRYSFDDRTLIGGIHAWLSEVSIFGTH